MGMCGVLAKCRGRAVKRVHDAGDEGFFSIYVCDDVDHELRARAMVVRQGHEWKSTPLPQASTPQAEAEASLF